MTQNFTELKTEKHGTMSQSKLLYPKLSYQIRGAFFAVYKALGPYHKESIYANALTRLFNNYFDIVIPCLTRNLCRFQLEAGMTKAVELLNSL